ncbi:MAG: rRNA maturation RNase YbeY [Phycisphaerales bacterium]
MDVINADESLPPEDILWLQAMGDRAVELLVAQDERARTPHEVRVRLVGDTEMASAHEQYSNVEGTTDVLTFDLSGDGETLDVDIMVCVDEAHRQGDRLGHETKREALLYMIHGMLHCLGYDDHDDASYLRMHAAEDEVLQRLGVGVTFAAKKMNKDSL